MLLLLAKNATFHQQLHIYRMIKHNVYHLVHQIQAHMLILLQILKIIHVIIVTLQYQIAHLALIQQNVDFLIKIINLIFL